ncbi:MAG: XRE family transcriptional regulator [Acidobacteria bacterium]|nr:MAG: XRE family transcriptional regulator [Acidobacteriota bacterium]
MLIKLLLPGSDIGDHKVHTYIRTRNRNVHRAGLRKKRSLTQQQLCDLVGVHVTMLSSYESERSQPTLEVIRKLTLALDVMADELVFDKTERQPQMLDKELLKNWEKIEELPDDDKMAVKKIVSALLIKHSVELAVR